MFPVDLPNHRSSHTVPTPRGGGVIFVSIWGMVILSLFFLGSEIPKQTLFMIFIPTFVISFIGFLSDFYTLNSLWRLFGQMLAAIIFLAFSKETTLFYLIPAFFWILWSTNLFNFMDGTDGIASIEAIFVLGFGGLLFYVNQQPSLSLLAILMVVVVAGFLIWNWPRAKIFMGDTGSYTLGFLIAILALISQKQGYSILLWLMLYSVFWFDASITLLRRLIYREAIFSAHKKHAYQRLHQAGWSHKKILVSLIALNSFLSLLTFMSFKDPTLMPWAFGAIIFCLFGIYYKIEHLCPFNQDLH